MLRRILLSARISRVKKPFDSGKLQNYSISSVNREGILSDIMNIFNENHIELTYV
jgi:hypothetical protein